MGRKVRSVGGSSHLKHRILIIGPALTQKGGMASVQKLILKEMPSAFEAVHISTHDEGSLWHRLRVFSIATVDLISKLLRRQVDLVHLHVSEKGSVLRKILLLLLVKAFGRPVVMHTHGCEFHVFHEGLGSVPRSLVNWALQQADGFITLSEGWRKYYIQHCNLNSARVIALPNPVEMPPTVPNRTQGTPTNFAFLGRIGHRKGAFDLIRAFSVLQNRANARLWLAGDGETEAAAALITSLGLGDAVRLLGWVNEEQRAEVLATAHVFVLPSYNEALPMAMLEAMAAALPVISTPVGGIAEFVTDGDEGYLVSPGDVDALSQAMEALIERPAERQAMGERARDRIRPLNLKHYGQRLTSIYATLLGGQLLEDPLLESMSGSSQKGLSELASTESLATAEQTRNHSASRGPLPLAASRSHRSGKR